MSNRWRPNLGTYGVVRGKGLLLEYVKLRLREKGLSPTNEIQDDVGRVALIYDDFVAVARSRPYGNILSIHQTLIEYAIYQKVFVALWLDTAKKFYKVDPVEVKRIGEENLRGTQIMLNFPITTLQKLEGSIWS